MGQGTEGHIHVCTTCGKKLQIPERLYGKAVRCPGCRTEFKARAPERSAHSPPAESAAELEGAPRRPPPSSQAPSAPSPSAGSYSHVCTACGAVMPIHPRYFGRELKCTSCRTEFVATPPVDSTTPGPPAEFEVARATGESPSVSGDKHRWRWVIGAIVVVVAIAVPLWWLGEDRRQGPGSELFTVDKARTELGSLWCEGRETVTVSLDRETVRELIAALEADDKAAVQALQSSSRCTEVPAGTRVRVLERRKRAVEARVRIIEGPWASRIVWVPIDWVR